MFEKLRSLQDRLPSFVWLLLILLGLVLLIGGIIAIFLGLATIEGFASVLLILAGWGVLEGIGVEEKLGSVATAGGILFFALMGMAVDQPGNPIYNQPIQWIYCPVGSVLNRGVDVSNPLPGRTDVTQDFRCMERDSDATVVLLDPLQIIPVRLVEYIIIGYALLYLHKLYHRLRSRSDPAAP